MDITIQFARPLKKGVVQNYSEAVGLSKLDDTFSQV